MLQHVLIGDAAPALLVLSLRGPLLASSCPFRSAVCAPASSGCPLGEPCRLGGGDRRLARAGRLRRRSRHPVLHELEHASFVAVGSARLDAAARPARRRRLSPVQRLAFAGCLFALGQLLTDVLFLSRPLYRAYATGAGDQQLAGLVMMAEQTVALGTLAVFLVRELLRATASSRRAAPLAATA